MENYVEAVNPEKTYVETMFKVSFRVHCEDDEELIVWYVNNFDNWLYSKNLEILNCTLGLHRDTGNFHFHYHTVVIGKVFKKSYQANPITLFKSDYKSGLIKTVFDKGVSPFKTIHEQKYGTRGNISIKHTFVTDDEDTITYLQYPLKEGNTISYINKIKTIDVDVDQLTKNAMAEYRVARRKAEKFKEKKIKLENSWAELVEYLDKQGCETSHWEHIIICVTKYYMEKKNKPPTFRKMEVDADAYAFYRQTPEFDYLDVAKQIIERRKGVK